MNSQLASSPKCQRVLPRLGRQLACRARALADRCGSSRPDGREREACADTYASQSSRRGAVAFGPASNPRHPSRHHTRASRDRPNAPLEAPEFPTRRSGSEHRDGHGSHICEPTDLRDEQAQRSDHAGHDAALRLLCEPVDHKRASLRGPLASAPMTSAHPRGRCSRPSALFRTTGVRAASERRGVSTSFRPDPDGRDVFPARAGSTAAPPAGMQPAAMTGREASLS